MEEGLKSMAQIYALACCTIAATSSRGAKDGFLTRHYRLPDAMKVKMGGNGLLYITRDMANFDDDVTHGPLNQRAWVLQERVALPSDHSFLRLITSTGSAGIVSDVINFTKLGHPSARQYFIQDSHFPERLKSAGVARMTDFF